MRISKMNPLPFWTCILFTFHVLPTKELFAAELDLGISVQRNQRDISGKYNPHAGEHQHHHGGGEHHPHEGVEHHHPVNEEHKHVEEAQAQNTIENYEEAPIGYEFVSAGDQGAIEAPDTKFDYDDKTVAPVCGCVLKGQCGGIKEDQDTIDILRATPTTLVCGLKYQMCCKYDYYENGKPWPGVVDLYLDKAPCVAEEICKRPYGVQPTDVRDYGTIPHCPGFGSVRCLDGFAAKDNSPIVFPNEHPTPTHIDVPILPAFETNEISGGLFVEEPKVQTPLVPLLPISESEIPKTSYGVPSIPYTYIPPTPPPTTPGYIYPEPPTPPPPPPPTTPPPPPPTTPPPPPPTTPPPPPPPTTPPGYNYPTVPTPPPYVYAPPQPVTEEETSSVIAPPPPVVEPTPVYVPPPPTPVYVPPPPTPVYVPPSPVKPPPYVYAPPQPVTEEETSSVIAPPPPVTEEETSSVIAPPPPVVEPTPVYVPPPPAQVYEPPSTYTAPLVDAGQELLIQAKPAVPVFSTSRYYTPTLGYYRPKYYKRPKIGYFGAPYYKNFYYNPYYGGYNGIYGSGAGLQKHISFSKRVGLWPGFQKQISFSKQIGAGLYGR